MIFIPFNCPSLKNSKIKTSKGIFPSKTVMKYLRNLGILHYSSSKKEVKEYKTKPNLFKEAFKDKWIKPKEQVVIGFHFIRDSKREADYGNCCQIVQDLMVAHDLIEDDSMNWLIPMPFKIDDKWFSIDKLTPGVWITVIK